MTTVTRDKLSSWVDFDTVDTRIGTSLHNLGQNQSAWMNFMVAYASWNGRFANGVSALASMIGEKKNLFRDPSVPAIVADRSNYVASFVFDAARDEYDDHIQEHRDTHRCLGQATIMGMADFFKMDLTTMTEPQWLVQFNKRVLTGYEGVHPFDSPSDALPVEMMHQVFAGLGYHLGSELLADKEFSILDTHLRTHLPELVQSLLRYSIIFAGGKHRGYAWIGIHSGSNDGGGVEDDHFEFGLAGANVGLSYVPEHLREGCVAALKQGFTRFNHDHEFFFSHAGVVTV